MVKRLALFPLVLLLVRTQTICRAPNVFNPSPFLIRETFPDPKIFQDGDYYFITGTGTTVYRTQSFELYDMVPFYMRLDYGPYAPRVQGIWGFTFCKDKKNAYHAFATLHFGNFETVIAYFQPTTNQQWSNGNPITSWRLVRKLLDEAYESKCIDDVDGRSYLIYNGHLNGDKARNHIIAWEMTEYGRLNENYQPRALLLAEPQFRSEDRDRPFGFQLVEGTAVHRVPGGFLLLYSVGDFDDANYKIGVAYSKTLLPKDGSQYQKVIVSRPDGPEIQYLMQSDRPDLPNYWGNALNGPGIGNLVQLNKCWFMVFHARPPGITKTDGMYRFVRKIPVTLMISDRIKIENWLRLPSPA